MSVERIAQNVRTPVAIEIGMRHLPQRVNAGVGATGAAHRDLRSAKGGESRFDRLLDRGAVRLPLPADEIRPVIFYGELIARHRSTTRSKALNGDPGSIKTYYASREISCRQECAGRAGILPRSWATCRRAALRGVARLRLRRRLSIGHRGRGPAARRPRLSGCAKL